jgi:hypothetical protein
LIISLQGGEKLSLEQIRALLEASKEVRFTGQNRPGIYDWVGKTLRQQYDHTTRRRDRDEMKGV